MTEAIHPCLTCGVCCTNYRVEFFDLRAAIHGRHRARCAGPRSARQGNRARMKRYRTAPVRCVALGDLGNDCVGCTIYEQRSRPCRDFPFASYGCHDTRAKFDLPALTDAEVERWAEAA